MKDLHRDGCQCDGCICSRYELEIYSLTNDIEHERKENAALKKQVAQSQSDVDTIAEHNIELQETIAEQHEIITALEMGLAEQAAEIERLRDAVHQQERQVFLEQVTSLKQQAEIESLRKDAERYRFLRDENAELEDFTLYVGRDSGPDEDGAIEWVGSNLDRVIDAAPKQEK